MKKLFPIVLLSLLLASCYSTERKPDSSTRKRVVKELYYNEYYAKYYDYSGGARVLRSVDTLFVVGDTVTIDDAAYVIMK